MQDHKTKSLFVAVLGETNAGKSTLINAILGAKVSIVSHKVQTTRFKVLGIYTKEDTQLVFIDTPGIFEPKRQFDKAMVSLSYAQIEDADLVVILVDAQKGITDHTHNIIEKLPENKKCIFVLNKIDIVPKEDLLTLVSDISKHKNFDQYFMISAIKNQGIDAMMKYLIANAKNDVWYFEEDQLTDIPMQTLATEITREKIYKFVNQELPYHIIVKHLSWKETEKKIVIHQDIYVTTDSHKKILLGKGGEKIKQIRLASTDEMQNEFEKRINLFLHVKVDEKLFLRSTTFSSIGLDFK